MGQITKNPCPECEDGELVEKTGKYGTFVACTNYPECRYIQKDNKKAAEKPKPAANPRFDSQSAYVSYSKDLCIAMLNAHVEARKIDSKIEPIEIGGLMTAAVEAIRKAKQSFE